VLFRNDAGLPEAPWLIVPPQADSASPVFAEFLQRNEPLCGRLQPDKLQALFGDASGDVRSSVLLPMAGIGMLAIGSHDANRFHPGMGTVFLRLIAEATAVGIARFNPPALNLPASTSSA
jgi:uncharacterized protein